MGTAPRMAALDATELAGLAGTVSVWCGPAGSPAPAYARLPDAPHYAASTMKVAVLVAAHRAAEAGTLDLDAPVPVVNDFASALPGAPRFAIDQDDDQDDEVWAVLGAKAPLRWLARRMIVRSSNLATNVVLDHVGVDAADEVLRLAGAWGSRIGRGIADTAAREGGVDNTVTARDLATLLGRVATDAGAADLVRGDPPLASRETCADVLDVLLAQERREDLAAGLPRGTRVAHKNGWISGVRHAAGVVLPDDAPPYAIAVCTTMPPEAVANGLDTCALVARVAAASWADRNALAP
jgi:beta-lactamase class A